MWQKLIPIIMIATAVASYHIASKSLGARSQVDFWSTVSWVYFLAMLGSIGMGLATTGKLTVSPMEMKSVLPLIALLALACIGIEGGYLLAYRGGWKITELAPATTFANYVFIGIVGVAFMKESLTPQSIVGLLLLVSGITVFHWR